MDGGFHDNMALLHDETDISNGINEILNGSINYTTNTELHMRVY